EPDVEAGSDLLADDRRRGLSPERSEQPTFCPEAGGREARPLEGRRDRPRDYPRRGVAKERIDRCELGVRPVALDLDPTEPLAPRVRLETDEVEVRRMEHRRIGVPGGDDDELVDLPTLRLGDVRGVDRVLSSRDEGARPHRATGHRGRLATAGTAS